MWLLGPNPPGNNGYTDEQYAKKFGLKTKYQVVLKFSPKLSAEEYQHLREMRRPYEQAPQGMLHAGDSPQRAREAEAYLAQHPLPVFYDADNSVYVESPRNSDGIYPPEAAAQGEKIFAWLKNNFVEYKN